MGVGEKALQVFVGRLAPRGALASRFLLCDPRQKHRGLTGWTTGEQMRRLRDMIAVVDLGRRTTKVRRMVERMQAGDLRALARAISVVEDEGEGAAELLAVCEESTGRALRIGITGPPGAGKSTLVDQMVRLLRAAGKTVGVVAIDPSSPITGGALLGDRIRMQGSPVDPGVFVRSMASRGMMGGLAKTTGAVCAVLEAAEKDVILVETVGAGQDSVAVTGLVNVTIVVTVSGLGDDVQAMKAGLMEIADIFVVNKSDREGADRTEQEIRGGQGVGGRVRPVLRTIASTGEGVEELIEAVESILRERNNSGVRRKILSLEVRA